MVLPSYGFTRYQKIHKEKYLMGGYDAGLVPA